MSSFAITLDIAACHKCHAIKPTDAFKPLRNGKRSVICLTCSGSPQPSTPAATPQVLTAPPAPELAIATPADYPGLGFDPIGPTTPIAPDAPDFMATLIEIPSAPIGAPAPAPADQRRELTKDEIRKLKDRAYYHANKHRWAAQHKRRQLEKQAAAAAATPSA